MMAFLRMSLLLPLATTVVTVGSSQAHGQWRFLPGDAYFPTRLTKDLVVRMESEPEADGFRIHYHSFPRSDDPTLTAYYGYFAVELKGFTRQHREQLARIYKHIRKRTPPIVELRNDAAGAETRKEMNGIPLYIYNKSFDPTVNRIGLRYNEDWVEDESTINRIVAPQYPDGVSPVPGYIAEDWLNAKFVPPLKVALPETRFKRQAEAQFHSMTVDVTDVQFFVMHEEWVKPLQMNQRQAWFYKVDDKEVSVMIHEGREWKSRIENLQ